MDELAEKMMLEAYERIMEYESRDSYKKLKELTEEGRETLRRYYENYRDKAQYFQDKAEKIPIMRDMPQAAIFTEGYYALELWKRWWLEMLRGDVFQKLSHPVTFMAMIKRTA